MEQIGEVHALREPDEQTLASYLGECGTLLELRDWTFDVRWGRPSDEGTVMQVTPHYTRKVAVVRWCAGIRAVAEVELRHAVAHELCHLPLSEAGEIVMGLAAPLGTLAFEHVWSSFERSLEHAVDTFARMVEERLPLIVWR